MLNRNSTHLSLLQRLSEGDDAVAWDEFCTRYRPLIVGFARARGLQQADAEEVLQEVLLALTRNMPGFHYDPSRGRFRGYLKTITLRAVLHRFRQKDAAAANMDVDAQLAVEDTSPEIDARWEAQWRQHHLRLAMERARAESSLTDMAAFEAYVGEGRPATQVAADLGLSIEQVYQAKSRILSRLRASIAEQTADEG